jgi:hypothetical protein
LVAGHVFRIIDEDGNLQVPSKDSNVAASEQGAVSSKKRKVGLWINKKFHASDADGDIIVPFESQGSST